MPWNVSDVDEHKKGLTVSQKKKWVSVANAILRKCLSDGGTEKSCAAKAIRIANSKFTEDSMNKESLKLKKDALCFNQGPDTVKVVSKEGEKRLLSMVAYSGKVIPNHWYWGNLAIDTQGLQMSKEIIPVLNEHNTSEKIGFGSFEVNDQFQVVPKEITFVDTPYAQDFIKLSDQGFPYEASIFARPSRIQRLDEGEETEVNGFTMKGPGTVWRESVLKECSICTFGADVNTKSVAMSEDENMEIEVIATKFKKEEESDMKLDELKAAHPELYAEIFSLGETEGKNKAEVVFSQEKSQMQATIDALTADNKSLETKLADTDARLLKLEKQDVLRKEKEITGLAENIFSEMLVTANIPERLHPKIRKQISHEAFVTEDKLDVEAFKSAISTELADWLPKEGEETSSILGMSFTRANNGSTATEDSIVTRMLKATGQKVETKH